MPSAQTDMAGMDQSRPPGDPLLELLIEAMQEGLTVQDQNGLIVRCNGNLCRMLGYAPEDLLGAPLGKILDEARSDFLEEGFRVPDGSGDTVRAFETYLTAKAGNKIRVIVSPTPLFDAHGRAKGGFLLFHEPADLRADAHEVLKLSTAVEQSPTAIVITDTDGVIETVNPSFTRLTGYSARELSGKSARLLHIGASRENRSDLLWRAIESGRKCEGDVRNKKKSGETYWAREKALPVRNETGEIVHYLALLEDITEHKRAQEALSASKRRNSMLAENNLTGIYIVREGRIAYANRRFAQIFGYPKEEVIGMEPLAMIHPDFRAALPDLAVTKFSGNETASGEAIKGISKNGDLVWIKIVDTPISFRGEVAILGNVIDITQEKQMEEILYESQSELRKLSSQLLAAQEQERKRLASELHDGIGQYLSSVKFSLESMVQDSDRTEPDGTTAQSIVPLVQEAIEEVRRISMDLRPSMLDDLGVLATLSWFTRRFQAVYSHIQVAPQIEIEEQEIPTDLKTVIYRITQEAFNNIVKHAVASRVKLCLRRAGDAIELVVKDNGQGFEMAGMSRGYTYAGLGLLSMKERAELSGGTFSIDSAPGKGVEVTTRWELSAAEGTR